MRNRLKREEREGIDMGASKENIKKGIMGMVFLVFLIMIYITFFSNKAPDETHTIPADQRAAQPRVQPETRTVPRVQPQAGDIAPLPALVESPSLEPARKLVFHPLIRDIFQMSPLPGSGEGEPEKGMEHALSAKELEALKNALRFKGSILYGTGAVAVINNAFYHIGDTLNGHRIVFISEKEVWIDTIGGTLKLEILNYE